MLFRKENKAVIEKRLNRFQASYELFKKREIAAMNFDKRILIQTINILMEKLAQTKGFSYHECDFKVSLSDFNYYLELGFEEEIDLLKIDLELREKENKK